MEWNMLRELLDYGGMVLIAIGMFWWLIRIDIPKRERRFERQQELMAAEFDRREERMLQAQRELVAEFSRDREQVLAAFREDRELIMSKITQHNDDTQIRLEGLSKAVQRSARVCAANRSLSLAQYLMERDPELTVEEANARVKQVWNEHNMDFGGC